MGNDIYKHLKENLNNKLQGKCYNKYGYISKIYKIEERSGGMLIPEDPMASAVYNVKFSCKLCRPLKGTIIICEVVTINRVLVSLRNGPINVMIFEASGTINKDNFVFDEKRNVLMAYVDKNKKKGIPVVKGTFVKIKIIDVRMEDKSARVIVIGTLESIATKAETEESITTRENDDTDYINYNDYVASEFDSKHINTHMNDNEGVYSSKNNKITTINENDLNEAENEEIYNTDQDELDDK
jgi:DNA-directed RNA polymerase subunit E'/Rpb7